MTTDGLSLDIGASDWPPPLAQSDFFTFVREERLFCATVAHLLLQRGKNLALFLDLINEKLPDERRIRTTDVDEAQLYLEFTYLRDSWNLLWKDNVRKRTAIVGLFSRVDSLRNIASDLPSDIADFNAYFMGLRGSRIRQDIVYPGAWSVASLHERFQSQPEVFRDLCKFKWSFNIKPDLVILLPGTAPICVEAKLESREGSYPSSNAESFLFDQVFEARQRRVAQFELQRFMFERLLGTRCEQVVLSRSLVRDGSVDSGPHLTWQEVFARLGMDDSLPFVKRLVGQNGPLSGRAEIVLPDQVTESELSTGNQDANLVEGIDQL